MNPDPNARDQILSNLSGTLAPASEPISDTPQAPLFIPDHELIRRIGKGSYGEVWLARNALGTWRAVKIVHRAAFDHDRPYEREFEGIRRFEPISRTHPSQLNVLHVGRNDAAGHFYYVMELADDVGGTGSASPQPPSTESGIRTNRPCDPSPDTYIPRTLRSELYHCGRLPFEACLDIGTALATALEHLHRNGLVHRDIKPSNIIFVNGIAKLADLGLVAQAEATLSLVGTEGYLPPEGPGTAQADIYSLGKVLYEMATGRDRQEFPELPTNLIQHPAAERAQIAELNEIIVRACHTDLKQRYPTAAELHADLALLQSGKSVSRMRTTERRLKTVARAGAMVTAVAVIVGLAFFYQKIQTREARRLAAENARMGEENRQRVIRLDIANGVRLMDDRGVRLMDDNDPAAALLWFADALPLVTNNPAVADIHRIRIQQTLHQTPRLLNVMAESNSIIASAFSPAGNRIATLSGTGRLALRDAQSGEVLWERLHVGKIPLQLRFARDGQRLLVCSSANQGLATMRDLPPEFQLAELLDVQTGKSLFPELTSNFVRSAFSPDDRWLAVALTNHVIQLLDTRDGRLVVELHGNTNSITMLTFSGDGSLLASGSRDRTARIWRLPAGKLVGGPLAHKESVRRVALSADGRHLATATWEPDEPEESRVHVWDVQNATRVGEPIIEHSIVRTLMFSPDSKALFVGGEAVVPDARFVRIWNIVPSLNLQWKLAFPSVRCWEFSPDGGMLALGTDNGFVSIWSTATWELLFPPFRHTAWVESVHFSPDGARLLTTSKDGTGKVWTLAHAVETARLLLPASHPNIPAENARPRGRTKGPIPVPLTDGWLHLIDPDGLVEIQTLQSRQPNSRMNGWWAGSTGRFWVVDVVPAFDKPAGELALWTRQDGAFHCVTLPRSQPVVAAQFNADDSLFAAWTEDWVLRLWRTRDGTLQQTIQVPKSLVPLREDLLLEPFDRECRTLLHLQLDDQSGRSGHLDLFDMATGRPAGKHIAFNSSINRLRVSPDGVRLGYVGREEGTIIDLGSGEIASPRFKHLSDTFFDLDWSPDSRRLITAGGAAEVSMWDTATGEMLLSPMAAGENASHSARWSADGRFIVTRWDDNKARVWDASTAEAITPLLVHSGYIRWACITHANRLITASDPNLVRAWDLRPTVLAADVITDYAQLLSGRRLNTGGVLLPIPAKELAELSRSLRSRAPLLFE